MKLRYLLVGVAAFTMTGQAMAQGFSGPRVEGRVGFDDAGADITLFDDEDLDEEDIVIPTLSAEGTSYGVEVGYDLVLGRRPSGFLVGAYLGGDLSNADVCDSDFEDDDDDDDGEEESCFKVRRSLTAGVRFGYAIENSALLYGKVGLSSGRFKVVGGGKVDEDTFGADDDLISDSDLDGNRRGFHFGAGVEGNLMSNVYAKLEYVHTEYKSEKDEDFRIRFDRDQILFGLGVRF
jgi:opacity protein-like surface antigen